MLNFKAFILSSILMIFCSHTHATTIEVVEIKDLRFTADSFFDERKDLSFTEAKANQKFEEWTQDAIEKVNSLIGPQNQVPKIKVKLIFNALITSTRGQTRLTPISIIDSYQEPKTNSIRLGMEELKDDEVSFKLTVAHEYAHLVLEHISRTANKTPQEDEHIPYWPKSVYEGLADVLMSLAYDSNYTAGLKCWGSRDLNQFKTLKEAKAAKDTTVAKARLAFQKMKLIPDYPIYEDWLLKVDYFIKSLGSSDPYAEGTWLAGSLRQQASGSKKKTKLLDAIFEKTKTGEQITDIQLFHDQLINALLVP